MKWIRCLCCRWKLRASASVYCFFKVEERGYLFKNFTDLKQLMLVKNIFRVGANINHFAKKYGEVFWGNRHLPWCLPQRCSHFTKAPIISASHWNVQRNYFRNEIVCLSDIKGTRYFQAWSFLDLKCFFTTIQCMPFPNAHKQFNKFAFFPRHK